LTDKEAAVLQAWLRGEDDWTAVTQAGYHPSTRDSATAVRCEILHRMDRVCDAKSAFIAAGMGLTSWLKTLKKVIGDGNPKYLVVALKLPGIALGIFNQQTPIQGAAINVYILEGHPTGLTPQPIADVDQGGLQRISISGRPRHTLPYSGPTDGSSSV
jgi:hypothetical protein